MPLRRSVLVCLLVTGVFGAQERSTKSVCVFRGTVRDSVTRQPVTKAAIVLKPTAAGPGYAGTTDAAGEFRFEAIAPTNYQLEVTRRGYTVGHTASLHPGQTTAVLPFVVGQDIINAVIALDPEAAVSGRVVDSEGVPIAGAVVWALGEKWVNGVHGYELTESATAGDSGQYRLKAAAGTYYLMARPRYGSRLPGNFATDPDGPEMRTVPVFYPGTTNLAGASLLEIAPGQQMEGLDFKLPTVATYHVRGVVKNFFPSGTQQKIPRLALGKRDEPFARRPEGATWIEKDGSFDLPGAIPGSYWLELEPFVNAPSGRMAVEVADRDLNQVVMQSMPMLSVKGKVRFSEPDVTLPLPSLTFHIEMLDWFYFHSSQDFFAKADGGFSTNLLMCGPYVITVRPEQDAYIQSITYQGRDLPAGKIDLTSGVAGEVEIVLATGSGQVEGTLRWPEVLAGEMPPLPDPEMHGILVSAGGETGNSGARTAEITADGHFQFRFVPPGRYFVFATARPADGLWQNMNFVEAVANRGVTVEIAKGGAARVEVPILAAGEVRRAMAQVRK